MANRIESFKIGLYREHLEEASALYDLCMSSLHHPNSEWSQLGDFEAQLEAHLDALVIGEALALQVCAERMREGDAGELFAALSVCCRRQDPSPFAEMWRHLDFADHERVQAVTDALKFELPDAWIPACERAIERGDERIFAIVAAAAAYRRLPLGHVVAARLSAADERIDPGAVWALSRMRGDRAVETLERFWRHPDPEVRFNAILGLLHAGPNNVLRTSNLLAEMEDCPDLVLGLAGDRRAVTFLRKRVEAGSASPETLLGLALLGDVSAVRALCNCLDSEPLGETAALALHWMTGASLYVDVFVPEAFDERELFEGELAAWRERGEVPRRADGRPYGTNVRKLSQDVSVWNAWLAEHASEFDRNLRYRRGQPYGPRALLECLLDAVAPSRLRQLAYEEMAIRFGCPLRFEADSRVADQLADLQAITRWVDDHEAAFAGSGSWQANLSVV